MHTRASGICGYPIYRDAIRDEKIVNNYQFHKSLLAIFTWVFRLKLSALQNSGLMSDYCRHILMLRENFTHCIVDQFVFKIGASESQEGISMAEIFCKHFLSLIDSKITMILNNFYSI